MSGLIYFISDGRGAIKIGFSRNIKQRLSDFDSLSGSALNLIGTLPGTTQGERFLHGHLIDYRIRREWFKDCDAVRACIQMVFTDGLSSLGFEPRATVRSPDQSFVIGRALDLLDLIIRHFPRKEGERLPQQLNRIATELEIPRGALWTLRYRAPADIPAHIYFALVAGAQQVIDIAAAQLAKDAAFINAIAAEEEAHRERARHADQLYREIDEERARLRAACERAGASYDDILKQVIESVDAQVGPCPPARVAAQMAGEEK